MIKLSLLLPMIANRNIYWRVCAASNYSLHEPDNLFDKYAHVPAAAAAKPALL